jgi:hypothetical protein
VEPDVVKSFVLYYNYGDEQKIRFFNKNSLEKGRIIMAERFSYKGKEYRVDDEGKIHEDKIFGSEVGEKDENGNITIQTGIFNKKEAGRISRSGDVYEKGFFGGDKEKVGERKDNCLLSSTCVAARGLPDDCDELTTLRKFRKNHLEGTPRGNMILEEYRTISRHIVRWIERRADRQVWYDDLYRRLVKGTIDLIRTDQIETAINYYQSIVREYQTMALTSKTVDSV